MTDMDEDEEEESLRIAGGQKMTIPADWNHINSTKCSPLVHVGSRGHPSHSSINIFLLKNFRHSCSSPNRWNTELAGHQPVCEKHRSNITEAIPELLKKGGAEQIN